MTTQIAAMNMFEGLPETAAPVLGDPPYTTDRAEQLTAGVGYEAQFSRLRLKGGVQRAAHERTFHAPGVAPTSAHQSPWLYDLSTAAAVTDWITAFATLSRGLEDSGVAPNNAVNRNEVLPPVIANQQELGLRAGLGEMTLIASAFRIDKPAAAFDSTGAYRLSGEVTHRGLELSLSGRLRPELRLLAGAALLDAKRAGELVEAGQISEEVPGVSRVQAVAGFTWDAPWARGLSFDGQASYYGSRRVRSTSALEAPAYATVNLGLRKVLVVAERQLALRLRVTNLFDTDAWVAGRSETLDRVPRRGLQVSLSY
ncbi:MAG: TonB-dependent receptor, partial [Brevundimonas sp.]